MRVWVVVSHWAVLVISSVLASAPAEAQVIRDGTLGGGRNALVPSGVDPTGKPATYLITPNLGQQVGGNLFQSFREFNIGTGQTATFTGPDPVSGPQTVSNVISRVTGGTESDIYGTLRSTIPRADVYLVNPSGILFGAGAQLDVPGSFHATTADYLKLADGGRFEANTARPSVLTVASPTAFGFLSAGSASIKATGSTLATPPGDSLSLVGGAVDVEGATIAAPGGTIHLAAVASPGEVPVAVSPGATTPTTPGGPVTLVNSTIDSSDSQGGRGAGVAIEGGVLQIQGTTAHADTYGSQAGSRVSLSASDRIEIQGSSQFTSDTYGTATGSPVQIQAPSVEIKDGSAVHGNTLGPGTGGGVQVAAGSLAVEGGSAISSDTVANPFASSGGRQAGPVTVTADTVTIDGAAIHSDTGLARIGNAGAITVKARETLKILDGGEISTDSPAPVTVTAGTLTNDGAVDSVGGAVTVKAGNMTAGVINSVSGGGGSVRGSVTITADTLIFGESDSVVTDGPVTIKAGTLAMLNGSQIFTSTISNRPEPASPITVTADNFTIEGHSSNGTTGITGGAVTVKAHNMVIRDGSIDTSGAGGRGVTITADTLTLDYNSIVDSTGVDSGAGSVTIKAGTLAILANSEISSDSISNGTAGTITITADNLSIDGKGPFGGGGGITSSTIVGDAGTITVKAGNISIKDSGQILTQIASGGSFTTGHAGSVMVTAGTLTIDGGSFNGSTGISSDSGILLSNSFLGKPLIDGVAGDAGTITVKAGNISIKDGGQITSRTFTKGNGGSVTVTADTLAIDGSATPDRFTGISSSANLGSTGDAGTVTVQAKDIEIGGSGEVSTATTTSGRAGTVTVTANTLTIDGSATPDRFTGISSNANPGSTGDAGTVTVQAGDLLVTSGGSISASTNGTGNGGNVVLVAGNALLSDGGSVSALSTGAGAAGSVTIIAGDGITLRNASISSAANNTSGGDITVYAGTLVDLFNSHIVADVAGGTGGNILIDPPFVVLDHSTIEATAGAGLGGHITIDALNLFKSPDSQITASAGNPSLSGTVAINATQENIVGDLQTLPANFLNAAALLRERCVARQHESSGSFIVTGRGGVPASPDGALASPLGVVATNSTASDTSSHSDVRIAAVPLANANSHEPVGWLMGCAHTD